MGKVHALRNFEVGIYTKVGLFCFALTKANIQRLQRYLTRTSFPISSERHSRESGNPVPFVRERLKSLDVRLRRSKAEPAFAGMTVGKSDAAGEWCGFGWRSD
jgi:hypothetical protein